MAFEFKPQIPNRDSYPSDVDNNFGVRLNDLYTDFSIKKIEMHYRKLRDRGQTDWARWMRAWVSTLERIEKLAQTNPKYDRFKCYEYESLSTDPQIYKYESKDVDVQVRMFCKEHGIKYETVYAADVTPTDEELKKLRNDLKREMEIDRTIEDVEQEYQDHILDFLDYYLRYDPNNHIRCNYMPDYDKLLQEKIKKNPEKYKTQTYNLPDISVHQNKLKREEENDYDRMNLKSKGWTDEMINRYIDDKVPIQTKYEMVESENFEEFLIPPVDTFSAFNSYFESNYEHLRQCTNDIYGDISTFELAIIPREVFSDEDVANKWENKYKNDLELSCMRAPFNSWILIDHWKENRDKIRGGDKETRFIQEITKKLQEEEEIGRDLLKKRSRKMTGRTNKKDIPNTSNVEDIGIQRFDNEEKIEGKVYGVGLTRSRRPRYAAFGSTSVSIEVEKPSSEDTLSEKEDK